MSRCKVVFRSHVLFVFMACFFTASGPVYAFDGNENPVKRTVLAFYDSELYADISETEVHQSAEMPLNHLGLIVRYQDIHRSLPNEKTMKDVRGILLWLYWDSMPDPNEFLHWIIEQMQAGKRVVIMGLHAFESVRVKDGYVVDPELISQFWRIFGMSNSSEWITVNYDIKLKVLEKNMTNFERPLDGILSPFPLKKVSGDGAKSYLQAYRQGQDKVLADVVVTGPRGGYVAPNYSLIYSRDGKLRYWYLNPFRFFREAFATDDLPKADTTTLSGRRIYYSHVDGDGWRSVSLVPGYREKKKTVTEVLLNEVFKKYPDLPVTVAPVAADLDSSWFGNKETQRLAKEIFALPNVEAGSHSLSHPMDWQFFEDYSAEKEKPYLNYYPEIQAHQNTQFGLKNLFGYGSKTKNGQMKLGMGKHIELPRAFYKEGFNLEQEIQGSIDIIKKYLPEGKRVELFQWSGNTLPYNNAIKQTRTSGIRNINGGDTRLDREFDSYIWVTPIGREVGDQWQIYSSDSNENTYTSLWRNRFYGFSYLENTLRRTETPWRLKPINVYYHNYSGERIASLNALHKIFSYAEEQSIAPITTSQFAAIADGFYSAVFEHVGNYQWRIKNRDQLQTVRFDHATFKAIDFDRSQGVIGQSHLHGGLYVHLDPAVSMPVIALKKINRSDQAPRAKRPYLIGGRWWTEKLKTSKKGFDCQVRGFGSGGMDWYMPSSGQYRVSVVSQDGMTWQSEVSVGEDHRLHIELEEAPVKYFTVSVEAVQGGNGSI